MIKLKELLDKQTDNIIIHCSTETDANTLLTYLDSIEYEWESQSKLTTYNNYETYTTKTCYFIHPHKTITYSSINNKTIIAKNTVIEFSDLDLSNESETSELFTEEILHIIMKICHANSNFTNCCKDTCPFNHEPDCITWRAKHSKETLEICKQWKAEHVAKPEPKAETRNIVRIMEKENGQLRIVYETDIPDEKDETEFAAIVLTNYCKNHTGTFEAHVEHILTISSND